MHKKINENFQNKIKSQYLTNVSGKGAHMFHVLTTKPKPQMENATSQPSCTLETLGLTM
jgi:hypothetical protein